MTKDDIETFEERIQDKSSFKDWSLILISGSVPLGLDKGMNYRAKHEETDLALLIICIAAFLLGVAFAIGAHKRKKKVESFKERLFKQDRLLATRISMVNTGSDKSPPIQALAE